MQAIDDKQTRMHANKSTSPGGIMQSHWCCGHGVVENVRSASLARQKRLMKIARHYINNMMLVWVYVCVCVLMAR